MDLQGLLGTKFEVLNSNPLEQQTTETSLVWPGIPTIMSARYLPPTLGVEALSLHLQGSKILVSREHVLSHQIGEKFQGQCGPSTRPKSGVVALGQASP
jgi:hypothetical protein